VPPIDVDIANRGVNGGPVDVSKLFALRPLFPIRREQLLERRIGVLFEVAV
jgi:hypothetical protein